MMKWISRVLFMCVFIEIIAQAPQIYNGRSICTVLDSNKNPHIVCSNGTFYREPLSEISRYYSSAVKITINRAYIYRMNGVHLALDNLKNIVFCNNTIRMLNIGFEISDIEFVNNTIIRLSNNNPENETLNENDILNINLDTNIIQTIDNNLFESVWNVQKSISMAHCSLNETHLKIFSRLRDVLFISLSYNDFPSIPEGTFVDIKSYRFNEKTVIILDNCHIKTINEGAFSDLELSSLEITNNLIEEIPSNIFNRSTITSLNLSYNKIKSINKVVFSKLGNSLIKLYLRNNRIETIPQYAFKDNMLMEVLALLENPITTLEPFAFFGLKYMRHTQLTLPEIPQPIVKNNTFNGLSSLTNLYLSYTQVQKIEPGSFQGLSHLSQLYLDHNNISTLEEGVFKGLHRIVLIDLSHNIITFFHANIFRGINKINRLYIHFNHNRIESLPKRLHLFIPTVTEIQLNHNNIKVLEKDVFKGLSHLSSVKLSRNLLQYIDTEVFEPTKITDIDIGSNSLSFIDVTILTARHEIRKLNLNNNLWECSYLLGILHHLDEMMVDYSSMTVLDYINENVNGIACQKNYENDENVPEKYSDMNEETLNHPKSAIIAIMCAVVVVVILGVLSIIIHVCRRHMNKHFTSSMTVLVTSPNTEDTQVEIISGHV